MGTINQLSSLIEEIESLAEKLPDSFAQSNLIRDLENIKQRLQSGMYHESDFEERNIFDVPRRTEEFLRYLEGYDYQAEMWAGLLKPLVSANTHKIMDLCPGWAPKIELALWKIKYHGQLYLIDAESDSIIKIQKLLKLVEAKLNIIPIAEDLFNTALPKSMDIVVANHVLDDLFLYEHCRENNIALASLYESEDKMTAAVNEISKQTQEQAAQFIKKFSVALLSLTPVGSQIVLTQYQGLFERIKQLDHWSDFINSAFSQLKNELLSNDFEDLTADYMLQLNSEVQTYFKTKQVMILRSVFS